MCYSSSKNGSYLGEGGRFREALIKPSIVPEMLWISSSQPVNCDTSGGVKRTFLRDHEPDIYITTHNSGKIMLFVLEVRDASSQLASPAAMPASGCRASPTASPQILISLAPEAQINTFLLKLC